MLEIYEILVADSTRSTTSGVGARIQDFQAPAASLEKRLRVSEKNVRLVTFAACKKQTRACLIVFHEF